MAAEELHEEEKRANAVAAQASREYNSIGGLRGVPWEADLATTVALWPGAKKELFDLATSLRHNGAGITYSQLLLAIKMADRYYRNLVTIQRISER